MSTHNICFHGEIRQISVRLKKKHLIKSYVQDYRSDVSRTVLYSSRGLFFGTNPFEPHYKKKALSLFISSIFQPSPLAMLHVSSCLAEVSPWPIAYISEKHRFSGETAQLPRLV